jgi:hypothetical protein
MLKSWTIGLPTPNGLSKMLPTILESCNVGRHLSSGWIPGTAATMSGFKQIEFSDLAGVLAKAD